jgi:hypothetical protein
MYEQAFFTTPFGLRVDSAEDIGKRAVVTSAEAHV